MHYRALVAGDPALPSHLPCIIDLLRYDSEPLISYFCPVRLTAEAGALQSVGFPASSADDMKEVPSIILLANTSMAQYRSNTDTVTSPRWPRRR
jgi:hypothetical protein